MDIEKEFTEWKAKMTPMNTIKFLTGTLISLGATAAVVGVMKHSLIGAKGITKLLMKLGIFVIGCKIGNDAEEYFKEKFDEYTEELKETSKEMKSGV